MAVPSDNKSVSPRKPKQHYQLLLYLMPVSIYEAIVWLGIAIGSYFFFSLEAYPATLNWFFAGDKLREASVTERAVVTRGIALLCAGGEAEAVGLVVILVIHGLFRSQLRRKRNISITTSEMYAPSILWWRRTK